MEKKNAGEHIVLQVCRWDSQGYAGYHKDHVGSYFVKAACRPVAAAD